MSNQPNAPTQPPGRPQIPLTTPTDTPSPEGAPEQSEGPVRKLAGRAFIALLAVLVLVRLVLPSVVETLIERQGSAALGVEVQLEGVDLALMRGEVVLEELRVGGVSVEGHAPKDDLLRIGRLFARVALLASLTGHPTIEEVHIDSPRVRLRRLADGRLDAELLGTGDDETVPTEPKQEDETPPSLRLAKLALTSLDLEFVDESIESDDALKLEIERLEADRAVLEDGLFSLDRFELAGAEVDLAPFAQLVLGVEAKLRDLSTRPGQPFAAELSIAFPAPEQATTRPLFALAGDVTLTPLAYEGRLETRDLPLATLARASGGKPASNWVKAGELDMDLSIQLESDTDANRTLGVTGRVAVDTLAVENSAEPKAREIALAWKQLEIDLREAKVEVDEAGRLLAPPRVQLAGITLDSPDILFTQGGNALASLTRNGSADAGTGEATVQAGDVPSDEASGTADAAAPAPSIQLDFVKIANGRFEFADHTTEPHFRDTFEDIDFEAARIDPAAATVSKLDLRMVNHDAVLAVKGGVGDERELSVDLENLALAPFNAYAMSLAGYVIERGHLTVHSKISQSANALEATNAITFEDLDVKEAGNGGFEDQFGMPLPMALALLRDHEGKIALDIPIEQKGEETDVGLTAIVLDAMRTAFVGALTSPLKLVFAAVPGQDDEATDPVIVFEAKSDALPQAAASQLEPIVALLNQRPTLAVSLRGQVSPKDGDAKTTDLDALARARATRIETLLLEEHALARDQVVLDLQTPVGTPGVLLALVPRPEPPAKDAGDTSAANGSLE